MANIISDIHINYPDCAITLSIGERSYESYRLFKEAGADRYLLRHETADSGHYKKLHPKQMSFTHRMKCIDDLKTLGYQVGCGFMTGSPFQTTDQIAKDLFYLKRIDPHMVGIGPFIPHRDTPFGTFPAGSKEMTINLLAIVRLLLPSVLLPSTTALGTLDIESRLTGIQAGANIIMPNITPINVREKYQLYNNKLCSGSEAGENVRLLEKELKEIDHEISTTRGDYKIKNKKGM
jgi:biotin synthase